MRHPSGMRWNDFGIANLRKPKSGNANYELDSAGAAFRKVAKLGRPEAWLNVARVHLKDRKFDEAAEALEKARPYRTEIAHWTFDWLAGLINLENGHVLKRLRTLRLRLPRQRQQWNEGSISPRITDSSTSWRPRTSNSQNKFLLTRRKACAMSCIERLSRNLSACCRWT